MVVVRVKSCCRLTFLLLCFGSALPDNQESNDLKQEVISSMNRVLDFFKRDYKSINLDGIFGLRVAQGALLSIINNVKDDQLNAEDNVLKQVKGLHNKASLVAQDAMPFLQESSPEYFNKFKKQVSYPWSNFKPFVNKKLSDVQYYKPLKRKNLINFNEETSDRCMTELTGTTPGSAFGQPCRISDECWDLMSPSEGTEGYALTHQALFFQLGEIQGCTPVFVKRLEQSNTKGGLEEVYNRICSAMYPEMTAIEEKRTLDQSYYQRDLFMEQAMVCGSMGYGDFLSTERLRKILSWQRSDGCFGEKRDVVHQDDADDHDETEQFSDTDADDLAAQQSEFINKHDRDGTEKRNINSPFGNIKKSLQYEYSQILRKPLGMRTMRSLLLEKELDDGCMSHVTGVATGLLGLYLRWLLYSHEQSLKNMEMKKSIQSKETEVYINDDLVDALALRENLQHQKIVKENQMQSAHLVPMRRAAMLEKGGLFLEKKVEGRGGEDSAAWRGIVIVGILLVLMVSVVKVFRRMPNMVKMLTHTKKSSHVI